jgi:hypothetical protein
METEVKVDRVEVTETKNGNKRFVLHDGEGKKYTTFRPQIGTEAAKHEGRRARITFHEEERNGFTNVYLDAIAPAGDQSEQGGGHDAEEAAWRTAVDAAPWLVGSGEPDGNVDPDQLFDQLKPFQEKVAADIREEEED